MKKLSPVRMVKKATRTSWELTPLSLYMAQHRDQSPALPHPASLILSSSLLALLGLLLLHFSPTQWQKGPLQWPTVCYSSWSTWLQLQPSFSAECLLCFPGDGPPSPVCLVVLWHAYKHVHALRLGDSCYRACSPGKHKQDGPGDNTTYSL